MDPNSTIGRTLNSRKKAANVLTTLFPSSIGSTTMGTSSTSATRFPTPSAISAPSSRKSWRTELFTVRLGSEVWGRPWEATRSVFWNSPIRRVETKRRLFGYWGDNTQVKSLPASWSKASSIFFCQKGQRPCFSWTTTISR